MCRSRWLQVPENLASMSTIVFDAAWFDDARRDTKLFNNSISAEVFTEHDAACAKLLQTTCTSQKPHSSSSIIQYHPVAAQPRSRSIMILVHKFFILPASQFEPVGQCAYVAGPLNSFVEYVHSQRAAAKSAETAKTFNDEIGLGALHIVSKSSCRSFLLMPSRQCGQSGCVRGGSRPRISDCAAASY